MREGAPITSNDRATEQVPSLFTRCLMAGCAVTPPRPPKQGTLLFGQDLGGVDGR